MAYEVIQVDDFHADSTTDEALDETTPTTSQTVEAEATH